MPNDLVSSAAGVGLGAGSTMAIKWQFDNPAETTLMRPSVLWGLLTGAGAYVLPYFLGWRDNDFKTMFAQDYGEAAFLAGTFSAVTPGGITAPTF